MSERNTLRRHLISAALCLLLTAGAFAQSMGLDLGIPRSVPSSGGGGSTPTWTGQTSAPASCGFSTTCNFTSISVTSGYVVAGIFNNGDVSPSDTFTALNVCGINLTLISSINTGNSGTLLSMFGGTVTGGICTVSATSSTAGSLDTMGLTLGTLNNLTSTTPGTACTGGYAATQASPYPCTSGITVPSSGFGIAVLVGVADPTSTDLTIDSYDPMTGIGIGHTTTSETPAFGGGDFNQAAIIAAPWR
jgi:hypothetical protein